VCFLVNFKLHPTPGLRSVSLRRMCFSSSSEQVLLRQDGLITRITMNRPEVHNAFNEHVIHDLTHAFKEASGLASSGKSRVVVFTGEGKSFSAGADLAWMKKMASYSHEENKQDSLLLFELFLSLRQCPVPIIAKVGLFVCFKKKNSTKICYLRRSMVRQWAEEQDWLLLPTLP
jgi:1,4-dihydroxy-2-naphthoyl-CoA synthase